VVLVSGAKAARDRQGATMDEQQKLAVIDTMIENAKLHAQGSIDAYLEEVKIPRMIKRATQWHLMSAMVAEEVMEALKHYSADRAEGHPHLEVAQHYAEKIERELLGDGTPGPWSSVSTSPAANLGTLAELDAKRALLKLYRQVIRIVTT
jgi:hypothetical protein